MFPIYLKDLEDFREPPDEPIYGVIANNGVFLVKNMELYRACIKVEGLPWLLSHTESVRVKFPKMPQALVEACMGFFYAVYRCYQSEAIVLLFFSPAAGFKVGVPRQHVRRRGRGFWMRSYSVDYDNLPTPEGYVKLGTWHSHADLRAYHSHQDNLDEIDEDGVHIVCGDLDTHTPSFSLSFMVNGKRFVLAREEIFEDYQQPTLPPPDDWLAQVECEAHPLSPLMLPSVAMGTNPPAYFSSPFQSLAPNGGEGEGQRVQRAVIDTQQLSSTPPQHDKITGHDDHEEEDQRQTESS